MIDTHERISKPYLDLQRELHARPKGYGAKGGKWAEAVATLARSVDAGSVLDYGCGRGQLAERLRLLPAGRHLRVAEYDPAIVGKDRHPDFADVVAITDVLEHIEPDRLTAVLTHVRMLARKAVFFVIALDEANKTLADGRNAHLILESPDWWAQTVTAAGFRLRAVGDLPLPTQYSPEKRSKRWIAVGIPAC